MCFFCEQPGHFVRECPYKAQAARQPPPSQYQAAAAAYTPPAGQPFYPPPAVQGAPQPAGNGQGQL